jgi:hypothetical protein
VCGFTAISPGGLGSHQYRVHGISGTSRTSTTKKKKLGRPKGSKNRKTSFSLVDAISALKVKVDALVDVIQILEELG